MLKLMEKTEVCEITVEQSRTAIESGECCQALSCAQSESWLSGHIGRTSVHEALRVLEVMGMLEMRAGQGTYDRPSSSHSQPVELLQSILQEDVHIVELLEPQIACMAAQSATEEDIASMAAVLERMETSLAAGGTGWKRTSSSIWLCPGRLATTLRSLDPPAALAAG